MEVCLGTLSTHPKICGTIGTRQVPRICLRHLYLPPFNALFRQCAILSLLRHPITRQGSIGILTNCPSTTPFGLALGPDYPSADYHCRGNLSLSVCGFLTRIIVTYAYIFFSKRSRRHHCLPSTPLECSPTAHAYAQALSFGVVFNARSLSTPQHSTSELLRTL